MPDKEILARARVQCICVHIVEFTVPRTNEVEREHNPECLVHGEWPAQHWQELMHRRAWEQALDPDYTV